MERVKALSGNAVSESEPHLRAGSIPHLNIGTSHHETDRLSPQVEIVEEFIHDDAEKLRILFQQKYNEVNDKLKRPHVLIAGPAGAGKSSIINTVFGSEIAQEGAGRPITQNFIKYCPEDKPIVLFDSKGLEAGMQFDDFMATTLKFFTKNESDIGSNHLRKQDRDDAAGLETKVHLVWYVVNAAAARFQDFEERLCRELFGRLPIVFILNKCDIATPEQMDSLRSVIKGMNLPNCIGILETVTAKYDKPMPVSVCPKCHSTEDLVTINRAKMVLCENCDQQTPFQLPQGLTKVLELTFDTLPSIAKESFVAAQKLSFRMKNQRARAIIKEFYSEQSHTFTPQGLLQIIVKMLTRLSSIWQFRDHGHLLATHIAKDMMSSLSLRDKVFLFVHKNKHQKNRATAIGIIWNRSVRELAKIVLVECVEGISESKIEENWHLIMDDCFHDLNEAELDSLEGFISDEGLEVVLDLEDEHFLKPVPHTSVNLLLGSEMGRSSSAPNALFNAWDGFLSTDVTPSCSVNASPFDSTEVTPVSSPERSPKNERKSGKPKHKRHKSKGKGRKKKRTTKINHT